MFHRYFAAALLLLLSVSAAYAQGLPGYVLTLTGDTLHGTLGEAPQQRQVRLLDADGRLRQFDPTQIRGYGLRGQALVASAIVRRADGSTARYFVLPRLLGPASLYSFASETGLLLLPPANDTLYELSAGNRHLLFNRYLSGCPTLSMSDSQVLRLPFEERLVTQLLMRYNRCLDPSWRPMPDRKSAYRKGIGLEADFGYSQSSKIYFDQPGSGTSQRLVLAWTFLRASGLQTTLGLGYTRLAHQSDFFTDGFTPTLPVPLAEQVREQLHLLGGVAGMSQRLGQLARPGLLLGLEFGFNYNLRNTRQTYQRPLAGGPTVETENSVDTGGAVPHLAASAGVVLPLATQQEVRLSAVYQQILPNNLHIWGLRAAYCFFRK